MLKLNSKEIGTIGIIIADEQEYTPFLDHFKKYPFESIPCGGFKAVRFDIEGTALIAVLCGIGKVNAASAAATLIHLCGCEVLLNEGLSGGVQLSRASFVVSTRFVEHDFDLTPLGYSLGRKPGEEIFKFADRALVDAALKAEPSAAAGTLGSGDSFISSAEMSKLFAESFDELACDMETAAIASVAERNSVPFLAVRKISDSADESAKDDYNEMNDKQDLDLGAFVEKILKNLN